MDLKKHVESNDIKFIKIGVIDPHGIVRGKLISRAKFLKGLTHGLGFCDVILGSDTDDQLCDALRLTGWQTGYPDAQIRIVPDTARTIPWEKNALFVLCEFEGEAASVGSRRLLQKQIDRAKAMGFQVSAALEYEFSVFQETPESLQEKHFKQLTPLTPGNFGYSLLRSSQCSAFYDDLLSSMTQLDIPLECLHTEIGPGVLEAAIAYTDILTAADRAALFKLFAKIIAHRHGLTPTFMAKPIATQQGQSGHIHLSLQDLQGNPVFYDETAPHHMSPVMRQFIAGQQALMPELLTLCAPNINSFARLVPGYWAPTNANWGIDNRTCALRVVPGSAQALRVEYRIGGADSNPYLALAAALASGLQGIASQLPLGEPYVGNAYESTATEHTLPGSLVEATTCLDNSRFARDTFGDTFVDDYCTLRRAEIQAYQRSVTDWQLRRYFEII